MARIATKTPRGLSVVAATPGAVLLAWKPVRGAVKYVVSRDGTRLATTRKTRHNDKAVTPGPHRYRVRARGRRGWLGPATAPLKVVVPARTVPAVAAPVATPASSTPDAPGAPDLPAVVPGGSPAPVSGEPMTQAMVDRLFWRAGFGPSPADRQQWTGRTVGELVGFFLDTPQSLAATSTPPRTQANGPIDPLASDDELIMEWLEHMRRATNPFIERMTFFWHRHWAVSRAEGVPAQWLLTYRNLLRSYADVAANPNASFRDLAWDMTTDDGAMSYFLTMCRNQAGQVNENYAREFMELFCLGVTDANGDEHYTQTDVAELARAFTGWRLEEDPGDPAFGSVTFAPGRFDNGTKTFLGVTGNITAQQAVDLVLAHPSHAPFLVRKLWGEFVTGPIPQGTLDTLVATYTAGGALRLKPLLQGILTHPQLFSSLDEPDMIKPPIVLTVGILRTLGVPLKWFWIPEALDMMQQRPYSPPNVAGWEGGLAWLNTNTAQARFELVLRSLYLKHRGYFGGTATPPADVPGETAQQAYERAYATAGSPWLSAAGAAQIQQLAAGMPASTAAQRAQRQYGLIAYLLAGPDAQVM